MHERPEIKKYVFTDFYLHPNIILSLADLKKKRNCEVLYAVKCVLNHVVCSLFSPFTQRQRHSDL